MAMGSLSAWSEAPDEFRIAFDRPLDPTRLKNFAKQIEITRGRYVAAADRFESFQPGYQAVKDQLAAPRFDVPAFSTALSPDKRTLIVTTASQSAASTYAVRLPDVAASPETKSTAEIARIPETDVATSLCGIEARWQPRDGSATQTFWLPHLDLEVARALTNGSALHAVTRKVDRRAGRPSCGMDRQIADFLSQRRECGESVDKKRRLTVFRLREQIFGPFEDGCAKRPLEERVGVCKKFSGAAVSFRQIFAHADGLCALSGK